MCQRLKSLLSQKKKKSELGNHTSASITVQCVFAYDVITTTAADEAVDMSKLLRVNKTHRQTIQFF